MELRGVAVVLRPVKAADVAELVRIRRCPEVEAFWDSVDDEPDFPFDDPGAVCLCVLLAGQVVGMIQYSEEETPKYRHAGVDLFLDPAVHGRGVGRDAVRTLASYLFGERGHHRLVIDPAVGNVAAVRCYSAVGFKPVGVMRSYERDSSGPGWHDGLLMDLLAGELVGGD